MLEDTVGYHVFGSMKALNTECWDPVLFVSYRKRVRKIPHKNIGNEISGSVTVFREPRRRMTRIKQRER